MSRDYSFRPPPADSDLRPDPRRHGAEPDFFRPPQESFSSSRGPAAAHGSQDSVLSLLSSCGLDPEDLSVLAKLPEDVLTVESLPKILNQIKGTKVQPYAPPPPRGEESFQQFSVKAPPSSFKPVSSAHWPPAGPASRDWEPPRRQPVQYPLHTPAPSAAPPESQQDRWAGPRTSARSPPLPSRRPVDRDLRPRPPAYGREGSSIGTPAPLDRTHPSRFSSGGSADRKALPPLGEQRRESRSSLGSRAPGSWAPANRTPDNRAPDNRDPGSWAPASRIPDNRAPGSRDPGSWAPASRNPDNRAPASRAPGSHAPTSRAPGAMPSKKQGLDFHGTLPAVFPYSCSLCDITVLSEKAWSQHINTTVHADGQLNLLQRFPSWDCRLEGLGSDEEPQNQWNDAPRPPPPTARTSQNRDPPTTKKQQKASDKGKVVCAKYPPQSVEEAGLRKLIEPFGKIGKILMFPSLAFVEMGSCDQAKDLVKFYSSSDTAARKEKVEFSISNTFSFLQSSQVVSFTPAPTGEDGRSDLLAVAKRFGEPLFTLFLPSKAFVEMKVSAEAQKLVDYYSSGRLSINGAAIQVAFSSEYRTLLRVPSAQKYEEEPTKTRESRTRSRTESRTESRERRRRRSSSRDGKGKGSRTRSRSRERVGAGSPRQSQSEKKPEEPETSGPVPLPCSEEPQKEKAVSIKTEPAEEEEQTGDKDRSACRSEADESDIEGMEVIAEDEEENNEPREQPEPAAGEQRLEERNAEEEPELQRLQEPDDMEEEAEFPLDLENCITLDELRSDDEDEGLPADGDAQGSGPVLFFGAMPTREETASEPGQNTRSGREEEPETRTHTAPEPSAEVLEERSCRTGPGKAVEREPDPEPAESGSEEERRREPASRTAPKRKGSEVRAVSPKTSRTQEAAEQPEGSSEPEPGNPEPKAGTENAGSPEPPEQEAGRAAPAEGATEPQNPAEPVGAEFVRPVVAYFCRLCEMMFSDEDEAKQRHCSTPAHYRKYQEKTGKDPWRK